MSTRRELLHAYGATFDELVDRCSGRVAAEVDGNIDNLEELLLRPDDPRASVEATQWLLDAAQPYRSQFPEAIQDGIRELSAMLQGGGAL